MTEFVKNVMVLNPVTGLPQQITIADHSGTITLGGTSQLAVPANTTRSYLFIQNVSTGDLWINFNSNATIGQPSIKLLSGSNFTMESNVVATSSIYIIGATTGQAFTIKTSS